MPNRLASLCAAVLLLPFAFGCLPTPDNAEEVRNAVAGTLTARPLPTQPTPPSSTPPPLAGLFCEYRFCIGHPVEAAYFDVNAQRDPSSPNSYSQGILAAYNTNFFIEVIWQSASGNTNPQAMLDLVLEDGVDTMEGSLDVRLRGDLDIYTIAIRTTATPRLPSGSAAAWTCGDRAFAWKAYTSQETNSESLLEEALLRFRCE